MPEPERANLPGSPFDGAPIIHAYTRAQALDDGELVDVSSTALEAGIRFPVAVTRGVWADCVEWPDTERGLQDEAGRLWDVVWMTRCAALAAPHGADRVTVTLLRVPRGQSVARTCELVAQVGPGDNAEPVMTIMLPGED